LALEHEDEVVARVPVPLEHEAGVVARVRDEPVRRPFQELDVDAGLSVAVELTDDLGELDVVDVHEGESRLGRVGRHGGIVSRNWNAFSPGARVRRWRLPGRSQS